MKIRKSSRLPGFDYSQDGVYFITICSRERDYMFSMVGDGLVSSQTIEIETAEIGEIISKQWYAIPNPFDSVSLEEIIVMPNHLHGIVIIMKRADARPAPTLGDIICSFRAL